MGKENNNLMLFVMYGSAFLAGFGENLMNMGLVSIMGDYGVDSVTAQWLVTGYMIVSTVMVTCMAYLYRRFKLRPLFFTGAVIAIAGSGLGLVSGSFPMLMAARIIQAAGFGLFIPMMMNTVLAVAPKEKLGSYMAIGCSMMSFGPAFAPVVCGALVTGLGWHSVFLIPFIGMIALTAVGIVFVRNLRNTEAHLDPLSVLLSALFLFSFSFGLAQVTSEMVQGGVALTVAVLSGLFFVLRQKRTDHPLIDLTPLSRPSFWPAAILVIVAMLIIFSLSVLLPLYFETTMGMSALMAGLVILIPVILNSAATLVSGKILDRFGPWPLIPVGCGLMTAGTVFLALVASSMNVIAMFAGTLAAFTGVGLVFSSSQTTGLRTLPPQENPFGVTILNTSTQIAACAGPPMFIGIMSSSQGLALASGLGVEAAAAQGFTVAMMLAAAFTVLGLVTAIMFARAAAKRSKQEQHTAPAAKKGQSLASTQLAAIMDTDPFLFQENTPVFKAMAEMSSRNVNGGPLVRADGTLAGYVSDGDIMRYLAEQHPAFSTTYYFFQAANSQTLDARMKELMDQPLSLICTKKTVSIRAAASLEEVCKLLSKHRFEQVPVVDKRGHVVGSIDRTKVLHTAMKVYLEEKALA